MFVGETIISTIQQHRAPRPYFPVSRFPPWPKSLKWSNPYALTELLFSVQRQQNGIRYPFFSRRIVPGNWRCFSRHPILSQEVIQGIEARRDFVVSGRPAYGLTGLGDHERRILCDRFCGLALYLLLVRRIFPCHYSLNSSNMRALPLCGPLANSNRLFFMSSGLHYFSFLEVVVPTPLVV